MGKDLIDSVQEWQETKDSSRIEFQAKVNEEYGAKAVEEIQVCDLVIPLSIDGQDWPKQLPYFACKEYVSCRLSDEHFDGTISQITGLTGEGIESPI